MSFNRWNLEKLTIVDFSLPIFSQSFSPQLGSTVFPGNQAKSLKLSITLSFTINIQFFTKFHWNFFQIMSRIQHLITTTSVLLPEPLLFLWLSSFLWFSKACNDALQNLSMKYDSSAQATLDPYAMSHPPHQEPTLSDTHSLCLPSYTHIDLLVSPLFGKVGEGTWWL